MGKKKDTAENLLESRKNLRYTLVAEGALVGLLAGLVAVAYRIAMGWSFSLHEFILNYANNGGVGLIFVYFFVLAALALIVGFLMKWEPYIVGSGIPQVEGELQGYFDMPWWRVLVGKLVSSLLCIIGGLSLGREGPSVQLGAMSGKGYCRIFGRSNLEERYLLICGASAGLSAAFNCPLAGVMFALEEVHKGYSVTVLFSAMTSAVVADFVSKLAFGMDPVFHIPVATPLPLSLYWVLLIFGVFVGAMGVLFNKSMDAAGKMYAKLGWLPSRFRPFIPFMTAGLLGFVLPDVLGDGHIMLNELSAGSVGFQMVCVLLVAKFLFSLMSSASGAPGGSLAPMLVIGAYIGGFFGYLVAGYLGLDTALINNFAILAMAGFFAAVVRAPLTAIVLATELTGSLDHMISLALVVVASELTARALGGEPLYDTLLHNQLRAQGTTPFSDEQNEDKTLVTMGVGGGSVLDGSSISEILWPESSLVVGIVRQGSEFIPHGDTVIEAGDRLTLLADLQYMGEVKAVLSSLCAEKLPGEAPPSPEDLKE